MARLERSDGDWPALLVERVRSLPALTALRDEWYALELESGCNSPFLTYEWTLAWWQNLRQQKLSVGDTLDLRVLRTREGKLVAIAPMMITRRPSKGPLQFRQLQFLGADPNITELRGLLSLRERVADVYRALLDHIYACKAEWDWAVLSGVPAGHGFEALIAEREPKAVWTRDVPDYVLSLPDTWEELRSGLGRNIKESLRKCYNSLARDGLGFELEVVRTRARVRNALGHFLRLHRARALLTTDTVSHPDVFCSAESQHFLLDVCQRFADQDLLRIFLLRVDGEVAAVRLGFAIGDSLYLYFSGFEPSLAKYSVMTTATAEAIKYAIEQGFSSVNLSPGADVSKTRWSPREVVAREVLVVSPTRRGRVMHALYARGRLTIEQAPALHPLLRLVRRGEAPPAVRQARLPAHAPSPETWEGAAY